MMCGMVAAQAPPIGEGEAFIRHTRSGQEIDLLLSRDLAGIEREDVDRLPPD